MPGSRVRVPPLLFQMRHQSPRHPLERRRAFGCSVKRLGNAAPEALRAVNRVLVRVGTAAAASLTGYSLVSRMKTTHAAANCACAARKQAAATV